MRGWFHSMRAAVVLSAAAFLLFLERVFVDFRYVALEMEAVDALMPFTAPYMAVGLVLFGGWLWGLLAAVQGRRGALIALLAFNLLTAVFGAATLLILCPMPCQTAAPLSDIIDWGMLLVGLAAAASALMALRGGRSSQPAGEG